MKEVVMKFLATTIAALSIAAVIPAMASVNPSSVGTVEAIDAASTAAKPAPLILGQRRIWVRRGKCTEDLGYGRTGTYGCG
jgi:hypothetical protein